MFAAPADAKDGHLGSGADEATAQSQAALQPLRDLANALASEGRGTFKGSFTDVHLDSGSGRVILYSTSTAEANKLIAAAKTASPSLDWDRVTIQTATYSRQQLDAAITTVMAESTDGSVVSASPNTDGTGIDVVVTSSSVKDKVQTSARSAQDSSDVPINVTVGAPIQATSWRWNDSKPFIGGDVVLGPSWKSGYVAQCTTGLAVEDSSGADYVTTAAHCMPTGSAAYGEGDAINTWG
jgi:hypothetical protein